MEFKTCTFWNSPPPRTMNCINSQFQILKWDLGLDYINFLTHVKLASDSTHDIFNAWCETVLDFVPQTFVNFKLVCHFVWVLTQWLLSFHWMSLALEKILDRARSQQDISLFRRMYFSCLRYTTLGSDNRLVSLWWSTSRRDQKLSLHHRQCLEISKVRIIFG